MPRGKLENFGFDHLKVQPMLKEKDRITSLRFFVIFGAENVRFNEQILIDIL